MLRSVPFAVFTFALASHAAISHAANQTATVSPVIVGGALPYRVEVSQYDAARTLERPGLHSFIAGEHDGMWVIIGGLTEGLHGFTDNRTSITDRNADVWVLDRATNTSWRRNLVTEQGGVTDDQILAITSANTQFEQVGERLYVTGGYGDDLLSDPTSRNTFSTLTSLDLPGLVDWVRGGANGVKDGDDGTAGDHLRQISDPLFKVTGGDMYAIDGKMHLVFGQDFDFPYQGNRDGVYTHQVRTFEITDDANGLSFTNVSTSGDATSNPEFRRRDLNVYPTISNNGGVLEQGTTVLSGVFTPTRGAWSVPVEIDADGNAVQADRGGDPLNTGGALDNDPLVFKQGMNNYHSAKLGFFSESLGEMHELLFGGITLQEYDPTNPAADAGGFVTDNQLPNTNQITSVIRDAQGNYEQHFLGAYPELLTVDGRVKRFGSNAEFFLAEGIATYENGVIDFDALPAGETIVGYIYGGIAAYAPHIFGGASLANSEASSEIFAVTLFKVPEPAGVWLVSLFVGCLLGWSSRTRQ